MFDRVWWYVIVFGRVWKNLKAIKHLIENLNYFFCSRVLVFDGRCFVRLDSHISNMFEGAYVPRLLSSLYQLFDLCLIKHVLTVWPLTSTLACLVTKQCLMVFGCQTFLVCPGPKTMFKSNYMWHHYLMLQYSGFFTTKWLWIHVHVVLVVLAQTSCLSFFLLYSL